MTDQHNEFKNELWWLQDAINNFLESTPHKEYLQSLHDQLNTRAEPRPADHSAEIERVQWQPIETAPRDGTLIDLYVPSLGKRATDCYWKDSQIRGHSGWWWGNHDNNPERMSYRLHLEATHWLPIPSLLQPAKEA